MCKASKLITMTGMYNLYCSLFHPYLSYSNEIWVNAYPANVKCLFTLQNKSIRLICNRMIDCEKGCIIPVQCSTVMSILEISEFVKYTTATVMFNLFHGILLIQLQRRFTKYSSVHSTVKISHLCCIWCEVMEHPS